MSICCAVRNIFSTPQYFKRFAERYESVFGGAMWCDSRETLDFKMTISIILVHLFPLDLASGHPWTYNLQTLFNGVGRQKERSSALTGIWMRVKEAARQRKKEKIVCFAIVSRSPQVAEIERRIANDEKKTENKQATITNCNHNLCWN